MNVKGTPNSVTMHFSNVYVAVFALLSLFSPGDCGCGFKGRGKSFVVCTGIFPEVSSISIPDIRHLDVNQAITLPVVRLNSSHFARNSNLKYLESITIHNTTLVSVGKHAFSGLKELHQLDISDNSLLESFHQESVSEAIGLRILSLSGNVRLFNQMSGPILISETLEELDLSRCEIKYLHDDAFNQLKQLRYLNLFSNKISKLRTATFSGLLSLNELDLSKNMMSSLPWNMLQNNSKIEILNLRGNPISQIPKNLFSGSGYSVTELDLRETEFKTISIPPLQSLENLYLSGSLLSSLKNFSGFPGLKNLDLSYTKITEIDSASFEHNPLLQNIRLSGNTNLPLSRSFFGTFSYLELMDISNCGLVYLIPNLFHNMNEIATLNLSRNGLNDSESLGKTLSPLRYLKVLDLTYNELRVIGEEDFSANGGLTKLLLSGNPLVSPPSLASTPSLIELDLSRCSLTRLHLPAIFRQAPDLKYVFLSSNNLLSLNDEAYLKPLEEEESPWILPGPLAVLDLSDNPWSCDPSFTSLVNEAIKMGVAPSIEPPQRTKPSESAVRSLDQEWGQLVDRACETAHYDVEITLKPLNLPPVLEGTVTAKFPIWLTVGISVALCLALAILLYKVFMRRNLQQNKVQNSLPKTEGVKISVSIVNAAGGMKLPARAKDYQRLLEDRSPGSPETPRIYRPPSKGGHFTFDDVHGGKDPEQCDESHSIVKD